MLVNGPYRFATVSRTSDMAALSGVKRIHLYPREEQRLQSGRGEMDGEVYNVHSYK